MARRLVRSYYIAEPDGHGPSLMERDIFRLYL